ncbi:MAG: hypothetical protein ACRD0Q_04985 [Acidimicrobiales bacterium]
MSTRTGVAQQADSLAAAAEELLPGWVERSVQKSMAAAGLAYDAEVATAAAEAGRRAGAEVGGQIRTLLGADVDEQRTTPLTLVRAACRYPAAVLAEAGVPPAGRDPISARLFPDDIHDLAPATLGDVDPRLGELGIAWGAAKAYEHLARRRRREASS